jgi:hypothetical protein
MGDPAEAADADEVGSAAVAAAKRGRKESPLAPVAEQLYLAMGEDRSLRGLCELLKDKYARVGFRTLAAWSAKYDWAEKARQHDEQRRHAYEQQLAVSQAMEAAGPDAFDKVETLMAIARKAFFALQKSPFVVRNLDEARKLGQLGVDLLKLAEVFQGGATERKHVVVINGEARRHLALLEQRIRDSGNRLVPAQADAATEPHAVLDLAPATAGEGG